MVGRRKLARRAGVLLAVFLSSTGLTACHDLWCSFIEGLTGEPVDCSHEQFPDVGDIEFPPLPPPPSLPTTTTTTVPDTTTTTSTLPNGTTPTFPTTSSTTTTTTTTLPGFGESGSIEWEDYVPPSVRAPDYGVPSFTAPTWTMPPVPSPSRPPD